MVSRSFPKFALAIALLASVACTNTTDAEFTAPANETSTESVADPNNGNSPLAMMTGASSGVTIGADFRNRVLEEDPGLSTLAGAAEGYDAMMLLALASDDASSDAPGRIANEIIDLTATGNACIDYYACRGFLEKGQSLDYEGQSGGIQMLPNGDPGEGTFGVVRFDGQGELIGIDSTTALADELDSTPPKADLLYGAEPDGVLRVATLLPVEGPSGANAAAALAGVRVAVEEINSFGGPSGNEVELLEDSAGDGSVEAIEAAVEQILTQNVDAVIGGTVAQIDKVALEPLTDAGIIMISPTDDSREFSVAPDRGLFFRLATPEFLEGKALGRIIVNEGHAEVGLLSGDRVTDLDFANDIEKALVSNGAEITNTVALDLDQPIGAQLEEFFEEDMSAVVISGTPEYASEVIRGLVELGKGPRAFPVFGSSEVMVPRLGELLPST